MDEFGKAGAEMSYVQSQMHSEYGSAESIADSDLEDGGENAGFTTVFAESRRLRIISNATCTGKPAALFSLGSEERGNKFKSSVFKNSDPSNLGRSLLEGDKDHLLSHTRAELMRREHQVGSLNDCGEKHKFFSAVNNTIF